MSTVGNILRDLKRSKITSHYASKNRLIPSWLYHKLKTKKFCDYCHKRINGFPEIHHKIPISKGGKSDESNLMAVHKSCHKKLDEESND